MLLAPGAFITTMPRALAAATSTLSTPVPARAIARSFGAAAMSAAVTLVALRTTMRVGVGEIGGQLFGRAACAGIDVPAFGAQQVERGCGKVVGDNDFQVCPMRSGRRCDGMNRQSSIDVRKYNLRRAS